MVKPLLTKLPSNYIKSLSKLTVWVPLSICILLGIALWQYDSQSDPADAIAPDSQTDDPTAPLKTDAVDLLIETSAGERLTEGGSQDMANPAAAEPIDSDLSPDLSLTQPTGPLSAQTNSQSPASQTTAPLLNSDPFANYRAEYQFPADLDTATSYALPLTQASPTTPDRVDLGAGVANSTAPNRDSALSEALRQQEETREAKEAREARAQSAGQARDQTRIQNGPSRSRSGLENNAERSQPVLSGQAVNAPYVLPNAAASPPVGTTEYRPPANPSLPTGFSPADPQPAQPLSPASSRSFPASPAVPNSPGVLYTPPAFTQPDQGRPINPRQ